MRNNKIRYVEILIVSISRVFRTDVKISYPVGIFLDSEHSFFHQDDSNMKGYLAVHFRSSDVYCTIYICTPIVRSRPIWMPCFEIVWHNPLSTRNGHHQERHHIFHQPAAAAAATNDSTFEPNIRFCCRNRGKVGQCNTSARGKRRREIATNRSRRL